MSYGPGWTYVQRFYSCYRLTMCGSECIYLCWYEEKKIREPCSEGEHSSNRLVDS